MINSIPGERAPIIFLIGMPAVGKTWWGSRIAAHYQLSFIDLDAFIAEQEHASINALFAQYGEKGFREREHANLKKVISETREPSIIACGGGTPCFNDNMRLMKEAGAVVYLKADVTYLLGNVTHTDPARPLFGGRKDLQPYLTSLLEQRKSVYEQADYILHTQDISLTTFDEIISSCIKGQ